MAPIHALPVDLASTIVARTNPRSWIGVDRALHVIACSAVVRAEWAVRQHVRHVSAIAADIDQDEALMKAEIGFDFVTIPHCSNFVRSFDPTEECRIQLTGIPTGSAEAPFMTVDVIKVVCAMAQYVPERRSDLLSTVFIAAIQAGADEVVRWLLTSPFIASMDAAVWRASIFVAISGPLPVDCQHLRHDILAALVEFCPLSAHAVDDYALLTTATATIGDSIALDMLLNANFTVRPPPPPPRTGRPPWRSPVGDPASMSMVAAVRSLDPAILERVINASVESWPKGCSCRRVCTCTPTPVPAQHGMTVDWHFSYMDALDVAETILTPSPASDRMFRFIHSRIDDLSFTRQRALPRAVATFWRLNETPSSILAAASRIHSSNLLETSTDGLGSEFDDDSEFAYGIVISPTGTHEVFHPPGIAHIDFLLRVAAANPDTHNGYAMRTCLTTQMRLRSSNTATTTASALDGGDDEVSPKCARRYRALCATILMRLLLEHGASWNVTPLTATPTGRASARGTPVRRLV
ncbi:hypothetical protein GQ42DRAFT_161597 [Ramicandelaber brevisporus]|nr:hypothetical protein GQ42DRAFT_161597 [Ramicandelaber brevisporus]